MASSPTSGRCRTARELHTVRIVYRIGAWHGELRAEAVGSSDHAEWVPRAALDGLPLVAYVTDALEQFS